MLGQYEFGGMLATGRGIVLDYMEAIKWLRMSADQGFARAETLLKLKHEHGVEEAQMKS